MLLFILLARLLTQNEYGMMSFLRSSIETIGVFCSFGLGTFSTVYIAERIESIKDRNERVFALLKISFFISILFSLFFLLFSKKICFILFNSYQLLFELQCSILILFFSSLNICISGIIVGLKKFKVLSINSTISFLFSSTLTYFLALKFNILGIVIGLSFQPFLLIILNLRFLLKDLSYNSFLSHKINLLHTLRSIIKNNTIIFLSSLFFTFSIWFLNYFLSQGDYGFIDFSLVDISRQWRTILLFIPVTIVNVLLPHMVENKSELNLDIRRTKIFLVITSVLANVFIYVFSEFILSLYGHSYQEHNKVFFLIVLASLPMLLSDLKTKELISMSKFSYDLFSNVIMSLALIASYFIFLKFNLSELFSYSFSFLFAFIVKYLYSSYIIIKTKTTNYLK